MSHCDRIKEHHAMTQLITVLSRQNNDLRDKVAFLRRTLYNSSRSFEGLHAILTEALEKTKSDKE